MLFSISFSHNSKINILQQNRQLDYLFIKNCFQYKLFNCYYFAGAAYQPNMSNPYPPPQQHAPPTAGPGPGPTTTQYVYVSEEHPQFGPRQQNVGTNMIQNNKMGNKTEKTYIFTLEALNKPAWMAYIWQC
jgi:hypothetical protein